MDQALKERLIGAAVLVALGVWLIPLLLDGPDDGAEDGPVSLQLPIPDVRSDAPVRTEVVDLNAARQPHSAVIAVDESGDARTLSAASAAADRRGRADAAAGRDADAADGAAAGAAAASADAASAGAAAASADAAGAPAGDAASAEPTDDAAATAARRAEQTAAAEPSATGASASRQPAAAPEPGGDSPSRTAEPMASGDWAIQLGSFGEEENARRLAERVSGYGYEPRISNFKAGGRTMYRVRIGPHETRAAAEAAASSLSAHGFVAQVVTVD
ncbi:MAG: SPOR domain-containing protein [Gammaproteobacteria bacterium]|nr:SPOR domain-containing protein [Gammaproteobacteria bacterium]